MADVLNVAVLYNPFDLQSMERHEVVYTPGWTLADYMGDLAEDATWSIGYDGEAYERDQWSTIVPAPDAKISVVRVPEGGGKGGGGGKEILRLVAMIAIAVVAFWIAGPAGVAALTPMFGAGAAFAAALAGATFAAAGMMLVNALIPPPGLEEGKKESPSYGNDGAKNTSQEGVVVPVTYGKTRVAGNVVDIFTKNVGDDQYLFVRTVLNDGLVHSIGEIEINDQPIANLKNVEVRAQLGDPDGEPNDWFGESIRMINKAVKLTSAWTTHTAEGELDRFRFDLNFPNGLIRYRDNGEERPRSAKFHFEYRPVGGAWAPLPGLREQRFLGYASGSAPLTGGSTTPPGGGLGAAIFWAIQNATTTDRYLVNGAEYSGDTTYFPGSNVVAGDMSGSIGAVSPAGASRLSLTVLAEITAASETASIGNYDFKVGYRKVGDTDWTFIGESDGVVERTAATMTEWSQFPMVQRTYTTEVDPAFQYEVTAFGGSLIDATASLSTGNGSLTIERQRSTMFRYTFESAILPRDMYEFRIRRDVDESDNPNLPDSTYLQDVAEIDIDNIHYAGTANLSIKMKMDESIQAVTKMTAMVEGSIVKIYDEEGNIVSEEYSQWPCWHVLDILLNQDRGRGLNTSRIDYAAFKEWEAHCEEFGLQFNGIFDSASNVWDATQELFRVGHASMLRIGTKYSVVIDRPSEAVMLFNDSNIIKGTFQTNWLALTERANEIHYTYYPEDQGFKAEMIRAVDPNVVNGGAGLRVAKISQKGVTNLEQAQYNVEKQLRENALLKKTISFDAPIEAIGLVIGDVALVQHTSANYGRGIAQGRLKAGSTDTVLNLDSPLDMQVGVDYRALTIQSAVKRYDVTIQSIVGDSVYVTGLPTTVDRVRRIKQGGHDLAVTNVFEGTPHDRVLLERTTGLVTGAAELWDTDVIEERDVVFDEGEQTVITLEEPLLSAPDTHSIWMVGPVETVRKPFRLRTISGSDLHQRTLSFVEYHPDIYLPFGTVIERADPQPSVIPAHVKNLSVTWPPVVSGDQTRVKGLVTWESEDDRYGGADVYVSRVSGGWIYVRSVQDVKNIEMDFAIGEDIQIKVIGFNKSGVRAPAITAPIIATVIVAEAGPITDPTDLSAEVPYFRVDGVVTLNWTETEDNRDYYIQSASITEAEYDDLVAETMTVDAIETSRWIEQGRATEPTFDIPRMDVGFYVFRVRAELVRGVSGWAYLVYEVPAPALPVSTTGLKLNNDDGTVFTTRDAHFSWDDIITTLETAPGAADATGGAFVWKDYEVRVLTLANVLLRTEYTRSPNYTYSFEDNAQDSIGVDGISARRSFKVEVRLRGLQGQVSDPATLTVSNPAPEATAIDAVTTSSGFNVYPAGAVDTDVQGIIVWASETSDFTPSDVNKVYRGSVPAVITSLLSGATYYYRWAFYDAFDDSDVNVSGQASVKTKYGIDDIVTDNDVLAEALLNDIVTKTEQSQEQAQRIYDEMRSRATALTVEADARVAAITAVAEEAANNLLDAVADLGAQISNEATIREGEDDALASQIEIVSAAVTTETGARIAAISNEETARIDGDSAEATQRNLLAAQMRGTYAGTDIASVTSGLLFSERTARATAIDGLAQQITLLSAGVGEQFDPLSIWYFDTSVEGWTGNGTPTIAGGFLRPANHGSDAHVLSPTGLAAAAATYSQVRLRIRKVGSPTWAGYLWWKRTTDSTWDTSRRIALDEPTYDANNIGLIGVVPEWTGTIDSIRIALSAVQSSTDYFELDWVSVGRPSPGASSASLLNEQITRAAETSALASDLSALTARVGTAEADINAEEIARADAVSAEATARNSLAVQLRGSYTGTDVTALTTGLIYSERTARATADGIIAADVSALTVRMGTAEADINSEEIARFNGDAAEATARNTLATQMRGTYAGTDINSVTAGLIYSERQARSTADSALSSRIDTTEASIGATNAALTSEQTARVSADAAAALRIDTLYATNNSYNSYSNDPTHQNWPVANSLPTNVVTSGTAPTTTRVTSGQVFGEKALRGAGISTATTGYQRQAASMKTAAVPQNSYVVCEWVVTLVAGDFRRAGFEYRLNYTSGYKRATVHLFDQHASPTVGRTYRGSKLVALTDFSPTGSAVDQSDYLWLNNSTVFTTQANSAKTLTFESVSWREATPEEIAAGVTLPIVQAALSDETTARTTADSAEVTARQALSAKLTGVNDPSSTTLATLASGLLYDERTARSTADASEVTARQSLSTKLTGANDPSATTLATLTSGLIYDERQARSTADASEVTARQALETQMRGTYTGTNLALVTSGLIYDERQARSTADASEVTARQALSTKVTGVIDPSSTTLASLSSGLLYDERQARSTADASEVTARQALETQMRGTYAGTNLALVTSGLLFDEKTARSTADAAEVTARQSLSTKLTGANDPTSLTLATLSSGLIYDERQARSTAVASEVTARQALETQMRGTYTGTNLALVTSGLIFDERTARSTADASEVTARQSLSAKLTGVNDPSSTTLATLASGLLFDERQARVTADAAEVTARQSLETQMRGTYAGTDISLVTSGLIWSERQARSTADAAEVSARQSLSAKLTGSNDPTSLTLATLSSGLLYDERQARATAVSAVASDLSVVSATVGGFSSSISTQATAIANINGRLNASWGVTLDVNNRVSGVKLQSESGGGTTVSTFDVTADKFRVFDGTSDVPAFEVSGGQAYIAGDMVKTGSIKDGAVSSIIGMSSTATTLLTTSYQNVLTLRYYPSDAFFEYEAGFPRILINWGILLKGGTNQTNVTSLEMTAVGPLWPTPDPGGLLYGPTSAQFAVMQPPNLLSTAYSWANYGDLVSVGGMVEYLDVVVRAKFGTNSSPPTVTGGFITVTEFLK